jgi:hypothetical protein
MIPFKVNFETQDTILQSFKSIADKISKSILLKINDTFYRIVDFEFYVCSENFKDINTHGDKLQLENGKLYVHASGVDITIGDGVNHGGILLRSIIKLDVNSGKECGFMVQQFYGPQIVATEFFSNINSLYDFKANEIAIIDVDEYAQTLHLCPPLKIFKTKRVGLNTENDYSNLPMRFIIVLPKFPNFKQKIKGIEDLLEEQIKNEIISAAEANEILGYKKF